MELFLQLFWDPGDRLGSSPGAEDVQVLRHRETGTLRSVLSPPLLILESPNLWVSSKGIFFFNVPFRSRTPWNWYFLLSDCYTISFPTHC